MDKKQISHNVGEDLSQLSVEELSDRMALLKQEIDRLAEAKQQKSKHLKEAAALFKNE